jgi:hypothetical protein
MGTGGGSVQDVAHCDTGERATGGGIMTFAASGLISATSGDDLKVSGPLDATGHALSAGETPASWGVRFDWTNGAFRTFRMYVICARP